MAMLINNQPINLSNLWAIDKLLPTWNDGSPTFRIIFTRGEDRAFETGLMYTSSNDAVAHAQWLVRGRLVYSAWIFADISGSIRLTPDEQKAKDAEIARTT